MNSTAIGQSPWTVWSMGQRFSINKHQTLDQARKCVSCNATQHPPLRACVPDATARSGTDWLSLLLLASGGAALQLSNGKSLSCDVLIGADGANSVVARHLELPQPKYAGYVAYRSAVRTGLLQGFSACKQVKQHTPRHLCSTCVDRHCLLMHVALGMAVLCYAVSMARLVLSNTWDCI